jgi:hypothetical protein
MEIEDINRLGKLKSVARDRGGDCLSKQYITATTKISWICKNGHIWKASPSSILRGSWCPACAGKNSKQV